MIFSSLEFIFVLPLTLVIYHLIYHFTYGYYALSFLVFSSVIFYGIWNWKYVPLLLLTIILIIILSRNHKIQKKIILLFRYNF